MIICNRKAEKFLGSPLNEPTILYQLFVNKCLKNRVQNVFSFVLIVNQWQSYKTPGFYDSTYLHIFLISLRLVVPSLTEILYLQVESSENGTHINESMML